MAVILQTTFLGRKCLYFDSYFNEVCSSISSWKCVKLVLRNDVKCKYIFLSPRINSVQEGLIEAEHDKEDKLQATPVTLWSEGCFTNILGALQNNFARILPEIIMWKISSWNFVRALGTRTKFQLEFLIKSMISAIHKFWENILESLWNISETPPSTDVTQDFSYDSDMIVFFLAYI